MRVMIDRDSCISCGLCAGICSKVFRMDEDNIAEIYQESTGETEALVWEASGECPVGVIHVEE